MMFPFFSKLFSRLNPFASKKSRTGEAFTDETQAGWKKTSPSPFAAENNNPSSEEKSDDNIKSSKRWGAEAKPRLSEDMSENTYPSHTSAAGILSGKGSYPPEATAKVKDTPQPHKIENPWLSARRTWNDHISALVSQRDMWRMTTLFSLLVSLASVGGIIHLSSRSKLVPYVVEVDRLGRTLATGPVQRAARADPRIINAAVGEFITGARTVTPDVELQRRAIFRVYAFIDPQGSALAKMNAWLNGDADKNPFARAAKEMVSVQIRSVLPSSPNSWQVDWEESVRNRQGNSMGPPLIMRALITVRLRDRDPEDLEEETLRNNPMGILVSDFSWAQVP